MNYNPNESNDAQRHPTIQENAVNSHQASTTNKAYKHNHKGRKSPHSGGKGAGGASPRRVKRKKAGQKSPVRAKRKDKRHKTDPSSPRIRRSRVTDEAQHSHPDHYMPPSPHHNHIAVPPHPVVLNNAATTNPIHNGHSGWTSNPSPVHMQRAHTINQQTGYHPHPSSTWDANGAGAGTINMTNDQRSHSHEPVPRALPPTNGGNHTKHKPNRRRQSRRNSEDSLHRDGHSGSSSSATNKHYQSRIDCIWSIKLFQSNEIATNFRCQICGDVPRSGLATLEVLYFHFDCILMIFPISSYHSAIHYTFTLCPDI